MDLDTSDTMAMDSDTHTTARGLLMLMLRPIPTLFMEDLDTTDMLDLDTSDTMAMDSDTPDTSDMLDTSDTPDMGDTTLANRLHQHISAIHWQDFRQKWIVIILKFPSPVLQFQCYHTKSVVMVSRMQENQSGKNPTNIKITQE